ncbi:MAG: molybdate ABC transporter substrate-binding protein [Gemmatimonadaceae bacterium]|jgi:molybdate transport system substrate-binding protein|nr:molybdate ABC transporter substrate-binding protein [Gemmatimonadaceae bacterium]
MLRRAFLCFALAVLCACRPRDEAAAPALTVFAASSLRDVLTDIATEWTKQGGTMPRLQFEASSTLARQLREGARADVFVSAAPEWVDAVQPRARHDWLGNRLVLVVRADAPDADLTQLESLAMAGEQVPAGAYAREALGHLGVVPPVRTIAGANVRAVLAIVSQGGAQAGIVYATDAAIDSTVRISATFPIESHPRIVYTSALLRDEGRAFFDALQSPWAIAIARRHGFVVSP